MRKRSKWLIAFCAFLCVSMGMGDHSLAVRMGSMNGIIEVESAPQTEPMEIIVDVQEGRFIANGYEYDLASEEMQPILLSTQDGEILAQVDTREGIVTLHLGNGNLAVTQAASSYVSVEDEATKEITEWSQSPLCEICGRSTAIGKHYVVECGHYGCLMAADHPTRCGECGHYRCNHQSHMPCEHCGVALCMHVDLECEYMRNPAPTPFSTMVPRIDDETGEETDEQSFYIKDPEGRYVIDEPVTTYLG